MKKTACTLSAFLAKSFMKGNSLKRDFPCRWCTRKLSKVVTPGITRDVHTPLSPPFPFHTGRSVAPQSGRLLFVPGKGGSPGKLTVSACYRGRNPAAGNRKGRTWSGLFFQEYQFSASCGVSSGRRSTSTLSIMLPSMSTTSKRQPCQMTWSPSQGMRPVMYMNMPLRMV